MITLEDNFTKTIIVGFGIAGYICKITPKFFQRFVSLGRPLKNRKNILTNRSMFMYYRIRKLSLGRPLKNRNNILTNMFRYYSIRKLFLLQEKFRALNKVMIEEYCKMWFLFLSRSIWGRPLRPGLFRETIPPSLFTKRIIVLQQTTCAIRNSQMEGLRPTMEGLGDLKKAVWAYSIEMLWFRGLFLVGKIIVWNKSLQDCEIK